jgi:hypothetical protein
VSFSVWVNAGPFHQEKRMSKDTFAYPSVVVPQASQLLGSPLDTLATALRDQHDAASTIRTHLREARAFGAWLTDQSYPLHDSSELLLAHYLHSCAPSVSLHKRRRQRITAAIHRLLEHLVRSKYSKPASR